METPEIAVALHAAGLIRTGRVSLENQFVPSAVDLECLPAFPVLLWQLSDMVSAALIDTNTQQIIVRNQDIPLGVAVSMVTEIPLVLGRASDMPTANDLGCIRFRPDYDLVNL